MMEPFGRMEVEMTVMLGEDPRMGEMDVGGKRD